MSESNTAAAAGGVGLPSLLAILFIGLKLTGFIEWSWFWVLAPLWAPLGLFAAVITLVIGFVVLSEAWTGWRARRRKVA